jgi:hypothetical protein
VVSNKVYAVVTADVIGSRNIEAFRRSRDGKLRPLTRLHVRKKLILSYAVTAWDEFQAVLQSPVAIPSVILLGLGKVSLE